MSIGTTLKRFIKEIDEYESTAWQTTGLALALLSTLLATILAMGVFSVAQAQTSHSADQEFSPQTYGGTWGENVTVTITMSK